MEDRSLKNMFNRTTVGALAEALHAAHPPFQREVFLTRVFDARWPELELKQRMRHITQAMRPGLPDDYRKALAILERVLPTLAEQGFEKMVFPDFVEVYGLDDWDASMAALEHFTQHVSAEFAVRPFVARYPEPTLAQMLRWTGHWHADVRRLASEGCRPRLPWGMGLPALKADPGPILPILERLRLDDSESVRNSVANNLNDISKDHPDVVIQVLRRWQAEDGDQAAWVTSHALRTLVKQGHPDALALLGYASSPEVAVRKLAIEPTVVSIGESVVVSFEIESLGQEPQDLIIDYVVYLMRANGSQTPKVFKLSKRRIEPGETLVIRKKHSFAPVTTRVYYPGAHAIEPQINGQVFGRIEFSLQ